MFQDTYPAKSSVWVMIVIIEDDSQIIIDMNNNKMKPSWHIYYMIDHII